MHWQEHWQEHIKEHPEDAGLAVSEWPDGVGISLWSIIERLTPSDATSLLGRAREMSQAYNRFFKESGGDLMILIDYHTDTYTVGGPCDAAVTGYRAIERMAAKLRKSEEGQ